MIVPNLGINAPNMGTKPIDTPKQPRRSGGLANALFTQTQQRVLGRLFGQPSRSFTVRELITATGAGHGAVQREVGKLADAGLLTLRQRGNQKHYQADPGSPIFAELVAIVRKTVGLAEPLREALAPLADHIVAAFVYGSVARRSDHAGSDIDLLIVSDTLGYADVVTALHPLHEPLGRDINPTLYAIKEWKRRVADDHAFVARIVEQPRIWLIGGQDALATG